MRHRVIAALLVCLTVVALASVPTSAFASAPVATSEGGTIYNIRSEVQWPPKVGSFSGFITDVGVVIAAPAALASGNSTAVKIGGGLGVTGAAIDLTQNYIKPVLQVPAQAKEYARNRGVPFVGWSGR